MNAAEKKFMFFQTGRAGSFSSHLFRAIMASDQDNRESLRLGFPDEVECVDNWQHTIGYADKLEKEFNENHK